VQLISRGTAEGTRATCHHSVEPNQRHPLDEPISRKDVACRGAPIRPTHADTIRVGGWRLSVDLLRAGAGRNQRMHGARVQRVSQQWGSIHGLTAASGEA